MNDDLRKEAKKRVEAKMSFVICGIVFFFTSVILIILSVYLPSVAHWLLLPIPALVMILLILYINAFGLPTSGQPSTSWREEEIQKEMIRLYRARKAEHPSTDDLTDLEHLELEALERLGEKRILRDEDYVE